MGRVEHTCQGLLEQNIGAGRAPSYWHGVQGVNIIGPAQPPVQLCCCRGQAPTSYLQGIAVSSLGAL
jgi:hypothetical protein